MSNPVKVVVAESSVIIRSGLVSILKRIGLNLHLTEVGEMAHLSTHLTRQSPDLLIVNPAFLGHFYLPQLKADARCRQMHSVALLSVPTDPALLRTYDATVTLYDTPEQIREKLITLIREEQTTASPADTLSPREKEIVVCVVKGMTNKQIASQLTLSTHTVITHRRNIAGKLQIHSPAGLTVYAIVNRLVELSEISDGLLGGICSDNTK